MSEEKKIKVTVSTGWASGDHVDYFDLPCNWDSLSDDEKQDFINECANEYLHECCDSCGELVDVSEDSY